MFGLLKIFFKIYNRFFSPDKLFAKRLRSLVGFTPSNISIFKLAFYHKSASSEKLYAVQSNERLEYLGDAVLGTIVAEYLFKKYPNQDEGFLTKMRSKIVKRQSLNQIADKMGLDVFLNQYNNTRLSRSMLGNALEALVGAVYIECGYNKTRHYVIQKILRGYLDIHELESFDDNYKSQLLEWCQKNGQTVSYKMLAKYKFEKRDRFKVAVLIDGKKLASADDFNKKSAEQTASEKAMQLLGLLKDGKEEENKKGAKRKGRNPRSPRPEREDNGRRDNRNNTSNRRKSESPKKDQSPARQTTKEPTPKAKEESDWSDVKLDIGDTPPKDTRRKSGNNNSRSATPSNRRRKPEQKKQQAKEDNTASKSNGEVQKPEAKPKPENKRRPQKNRTPQKPKVEKEADPQAEASQEMPTKREKAPRIAKKAINKKPNKEVAEVKGKELAATSDTPTENPVEKKPVKRNNSRRGRGRSSNSTNQQNTNANVDADIEEVFEIDIPVDLTQDLSKKTPIQPIEKGPGAIDTNPPV